MTGQELLDAYFKTNVGDIVQRSIMLKTPDDKNGNFKGMTIAHVVGIKTEKDGVYMKAAIITVSNDGPYGRKIEEGIDCNDDGFFEKMRKNPGKNGEYVILTDEQPVHPRIKEVWATLYAEQVKKEVNNEPEQVKKEVNNPLPKQHFVNDSREVVSHNILKTTVATTGYDGKDSKTSIHLFNEACTMWDVETVKEGGDLRSITLSFEGDAEYDACIETCLFIADFLTKHKYHTSNKRRENNKDNSDLPL